MTSYIALLRGVNVGGNKMVAMAELRDMLTSLGFLDAKTLLQSGNAVFDARSKDGAQLAEEISDAIHQAHGHRPDVILRTADELRRALGHFPTGRRVPEVPGTCSACSGGGIPQGLHLLALSTASFGPAIPRSRS